MHKQYKSASIVITTMGKIMKKDNFILPILMVYKPIFYGIEFDFGLNTKNLEHRRPNLVLRKWQNTECEWGKDWLVTSYDCRPSSNIQAKHIQVLHHNSMDPP